MKIVLVAFKWEIFLAALYGILAELIGQSVFFTFKFFYSWVDDEERSIWLGYVLICAGCLQLFVGSMIRHHQWFQGTLLGTWIRQAITGSLFWKLRRLNQKSYS